MIWFEVIGELDKPTIIFWECDGKGDFLVKTLNGGRKDKFLIRGGNKNE